MDEILEEEESKPVYSWVKYKHDFSRLEIETDEQEYEDLLDREKKQKEILMKSHAFGDKTIRKGMIRHLYVAIDYSKHLLKKEYSMKSKPRHEIINPHILTFIKNFFDKNPLSQMGIILTRNERAEKVIRLSGNMNDVCGEFVKMMKSIPSGEPSLESTLYLVDSFMSNVPVYGFKELLILYSGIGTVDHGDIFEIIEQVKEHQISVNAIGFGAKVNILDTLTKTMNGQYLIPTTEEEYFRILMKFTNPSPRLKSQENEHVKQCIPMGFPKQKKGVASLCFCHKQMTREGYFCPRCNTKYCNIPVHCDICDLFLINSFHIARSYSNLFPVKNFNEIVDHGNDSIFCYGCQKELISGKSVRSQCPDCRKIFCIECDILVHESLHNCPGCLI